MAEPVDAERTEEKEISRLVEVVAHRHIADVYTGKRDAPRYYSLLPFEAAFYASDPIPVTLHNISKTGVAWWMRRRIEPKTVIYLREFSADQPTPWIAARVTHCTTGIRGFLIGAQLERPIDADPDLSEPDQTDDALEPEDAPEQPSKLRSFFSRLNLFA